MNNQQDDSNIPAWSPTTEAMGPQTVQLSTYIDDPSITAIIQGPHREPWSAAFVGQRQPRNSASNSWQTFAAYRENNILSDDGGTAPESLLEDLHFRYVDDVASYSGAGQEAAGTSHMGEMLGDIHIGNLGPHMPSMRDNAIDVISTYSSTTAATGHRGVFQCSMCDRICKSQSNLKKHELTHSRPHLCNYPGCSKSKEGFSTPNDLQRHKASVHKEASFGYLCSHPDCTRSGEKSKIWPRKDNFRTHLLKVHKIEITPEEADAEYRHKPDPHAEATGVPNDATPFEDLTSPSMDVQLPDANAHVADPVLMDTDQSQYDSQQTTSAVMPDVSYYPVYDMSPQPASQHPSFRGAGVQADVSFGAESVQSLPVHQSGSFRNQSFATPSMPIASGNVFAQSMINNAGFQAAPPQGRLSQDANGMEDTHLMCSPRTSSVFSVPRGSYTVASSQATAQTIDALCHDTLVSEGYTQRQLVAALSTFPAELLEQALKSKPHSSCTSNEPDDMSGSKSGYPCSQCNKVCNRACELKKHMKRHERPYGCTVQGCGKSFGSKNDWKRHESGQHSSVEAWACDEDGCVAVFEDRISFTQHLSESHELVHDEDIQSKLQSCRIGRQCDVRFWCGFCRRVVEIDDAMVQEDGGNGTHWSRRFDHIDSHLFGKSGLDMKSKSQWRFLEDEAKGDHRRRADHMSTTASVRSTNTSNGAPYKRKGSEHVDSRPRKRADGQWAAGPR